MFTREYLITQDFNWLNIQKNGSSYVKDVIQLYYENNYQVWGNPDRGLNTWCVIREPYERYIAGLSYDVYYNNYKNWDLIFDNLLETIQGPITGTFRVNGRVKHTLLQTNYFMFQPIDFFVKIDDLREFCIVNFGIESDDLNITPNEIKKEVLAEIKKRKLESKINAMLANDKDVYKAIIQSEKLWTWQNGPITQKKG